MRPRHSKQIVKVCPSGGSVRKISMKLHWPKPMCWKICKKNVQNPDAIAKKRCRPNYWLTCCKCWSSAMEMTHWSWGFWNRQTSERPAHISCLKSLAPDLSWVSTTAWPKLHTSDQCRVTLDHVFSAISLPMRKGMSKYRSSSGLYLAPYSTRSLKCSMVGLRWKNSQGPCSAQCFSSNQQVFFASHLLQVWK